MKNYDIPRNIKNRIDNYLLQTNNISISDAYLLFDTCYKITSDYLFDCNSINLHPSTMYYIKSFYSEILIEFYLNQNGTLPFTSAYYSPLLDMYRRYSIGYPKDDSLSIKDDSRDSTFLNNKNKRLRTHYPDVYKFLLDKGFFYTVSSPADGKHSNTYYVSQKFAEDIIYFLENATIFDPAQIRFNTLACSNMAQDLIENSSYPTLTEYLFEKSTSLYLQLLIFQNCSYILSQYLFSFDRSFVPSEMQSYNDCTGIVSHLGNTSISLLFSSPSLRHCIYKNLCTTQLPYPLIYDLYYVEPLLSTTFLYALERLNQIGNIDTLIQNIENEILSTPSNTNYINMQQDLLSLNRVHSLSLPKGKHIDPYNPLKNLASSKKKSLITGIEKVLSVNELLVSQRSATYVYELYKKSPESIFSTTSYNPELLQNVIHTTQYDYSHMLTASINCNVLPSLRNLKI